MKPLSKNANITWKINTKTINNTKVYGVKQMIAILLIIIACVLLFGDDDRKDSHFNNLRYCYPACRHDGKNLNCHNGFNVKEIKEE